MADGTLTSVGKIVGGILSGGMGSIPGIVDKSLELILKLTADDPIKRVKALREYQRLLEEIITEAPNAENKDVTTFTLAFLKLYNAE